MAENESSPDDDGTSDQEPENKHKARELLHRPAVRVGLVVIAVLVIAGGIAFWIHARRFESTDDAFVDARIVRLAPQITGRVISVHANDNQLVHAGDVSANLAQIEAQRALAQTELSQAHTQVSSSEAAYEQAKSMVASASAQAQNASSDLARFTSLQASNPLAVAQAQVDQATAAARSTAAQRNAAQQQANSAQAAIAAARAQESGAGARIKVLDAQVEAARRNFGYAKIVAPLDGHIAQRRVAVGSYVSPGQEMLAIVPLQMWVTANFKETQLAEVRPGQRVQFDIDACPDAAAEGHVESIQRGAGQAFALLPPENATGNFVKVVQRVPVKIVFDRLPRDCPIGPGLSVAPNIRVR